LANTKTIQWKALILLIIFGLNTVLGFACAIGGNIGAKSHHKKNDQKHEHQSNVHTKHVHGVPAKHSHDHGDAHKHANVKSQNENKEKDNCCKEEVAKFQNLDKALNQNSKAIISPMLIAYVNNFFLSVDAVTTAYSQTVYRTFYPPPKGILTIIHRYQI